MMSERGAELPHGEAKAKIANRIGGEERTLAAEPQRPVGEQARVEAKRLRCKQERRRYASEDGGMKFQPLHAMRYLHSWGSLRLRFFAARRPERPDIHAASGSAKDGGPARYSTSEGCTLRILFSEQSSCCSSAGVMQIAWMEIPA